MGGRKPTVEVVAARTHLGFEIIHAQEIAEAVVVGVVAGCALELMLVVERQLRGECCRVTEPPFARGQRRVVDEGDGMVVGEISSNVAGIAG